MPPVAGKNLLPSLPTNFPLTYPTLAELAQALEPDLQFQEGPDLGLYYEVGPGRYLVAVQNPDRCSLDWWVCEGTPVTGPERCYRIDQDQWRAQFLKLLPGGSGSLCCCQPRCCSCPPHLPC